MLKVDWNESRYKKHIKQEYENQTMKSQQKLFNRSDFRFYFAIFQLLFLSIATEIYII